MYPDSSLGMDFYISSWICRFFRQFFLYFFLHQMSIGLFRLMGSLGRNMIVANTFGSFAMLVVMALGGYIISRGQTEILSLFACFIFHFICLFIFLLHCNRWYTKLVDLGILVFSFDVCSNCSIWQWIPWTFLG